MRLLEKLLLQQNAKRVKPYTTHKSRDAKAMHGVDNYRVAESSPAPAPSKTSGAYSP
jgi:hypothetical protein